MLTPSPPNYDWTMSPKTMSPHLIERRGQKACSACGKVFRLDGNASIAKMFATHVRQDHHEPPPGKIQTQTQVNETT
jgi:hypothetical protein